MNKTILMGRLVRDPELRYTQTSKMVVSFTLAVKRRLQEETDFFNIVAWNKTGEFANKYFKKGMQVLVSGRLQNRDYEAKDGSKRKVTEIIAEEVYFADSKKDNVNIENDNDNANLSDIAFEPNYSLLDDDDLPF